MKDEQSVRRITRKADTSGQLPLSLDGLSDSAAQQSDTKRISGAISFVEPDARLLQIGFLDDHLQSMGLNDVIVIDKALKTMDWSLFEAAYKSGGRSPYSPRAMVGLILYGTLNGKGSLRELETLARDSLSTMRLTGGISPDHSAIGRFLSRHAELMTKEFFQELADYVLKETCSDIKRTAGDGTIIEAAASRFATVKREALERRLARAKQQREELAANDQGEEKQIRQAQSLIEELEEAEKELAKREAARKAKGKDPSRVQINPREIDAVNQPLKQQGYGVSYKPSVIANDQRIIVGHGVHASSETIVGVELLAQVSAMGTLVESSWDAGYSCEVMLEQESKLGVNLLIPEGRTLSSDWSKPNCKQYPKSQFSYDAQTDSYRCPADQILKFSYQCRGNAAGRAYSAYKCRVCSSCEQRDRCTKSKTGRTIKRYKSDKLRESMREKFEDEAVRERYRQRAGWVEPVFSQLRLSQGLNRFRRKGLAGVRLEFAVHALAYNLGRLIALIYPLKRLYRALTNAPIVPREHESFEKHQNRLWAAICQRPSNCHLAA